MSQFKSHGRLSGSRLSRQEARPAMPRLTQAAAIALLAGASLGLPGSHAHAAPAAAAVASSDPRVVAFTDLCNKVQSDSGGATEADAIKMLALAKEVGRPYAAHNALRPYLARNTKPSGALLLAAADNSLMASDFRTAVARYKGYLKDAAPTPETSNIAARLFTVQSDFLADSEDAYDSVGNLGAKHRLTPAARRFDQWYVSEARRRQDFVGMANRLALVLGDKLPIEAEQVYFWEEMDWMMNEVTKAKPVQFGAILPIKKLIPLVRDNNLRTQRFAFYVANLEFKANSQGKEQAELDRNFAAVQAAAKSYFDAFPTVDTVKDIFTVFVGGQGQFVEGEWIKEISQKREIFVYAFPKLDDAGRKSLIGWTLESRPMFTYLASADQWADLASKFASSFQDVDALRLVTLPVRSDDPTVFAREAHVLNGVPSKTAATINSLAAGPEFMSTVSALATKESWHLQFADVYDIISNSLWPAYQALPQNQNKSPGEDVYSKAILQVSTAQLVKSPLFLVDREAAKAYVVAAFDYSGADVNDKSKFADAIKALSWIPWTPAQRLEVYTPGYNQFKKWVDGLRQQTAQDATKVPKAIVDQIPTIESAFQDAIKGSADTSKAPDQLSQQLAQATVAIAEKRADDYNKLARDIYAQVRDFDAKKTPWGGATLAFILANHPEAFDNIDFQTEVLADQLSTMDFSKPPTYRLQFVIAQIFASRGWGFNTIPAQDAPKAKKINEAFAKAIADQLPKGNFSPAVFEYFRGTRRGPNWFDQTQGSDLFAKLIDSKIFLKVGYKPVHNSSTCSYQYLIVNEFIPLAAKYPVQSYFDDMYVEEAGQTGVLDPAFWNYSRDESKKASNFVAKTLAGWPTLPLGYKSEKTAYTRADLATLFARALGAEKPVRDALFAAIEPNFGKTRYDEFASGRYFFSLDPDVKSAEGRKAYFDKLSAYVDHVSALPIRMSMPSMVALANIDPKSVSDSELNALVDMLVRGLPPQWSAGYGFETVGSIVADGLIAKQRYADMFAVLPELWKIAKNTSNPVYSRTLAQGARDLLTKELYDLATAYSAGGLDLMGTALNEESRLTLGTVKSRAIVNVGGMIAVSRSDARFAIFAAQADFLTGNVKSAWDSYLNNQYLALAAYKDLDPTFVIWLIQQNTAAGGGGFDNAETLSRNMIAFVESQPGGFEPEVRAELLVAYADIAFNRTEFARARAQYERIASAAEYDGTQGKRIAELKIAEVDRVTKQYDKAVERLEKLSRRNDKFLQTEAFYELAEVKYDQEEYKDAMDYIQQVLAINPGHDLAKILEGKLNLKLKKLQEVTDIQGGFSTDNPVMIPGKPLKVTITDQNLSVVGASTNLEVRAWTSDGDEETFGLFPFGDSKTKYTGSIPTALGKANKGDHILQVLGGSTIYYELNNHMGTKDSKKVEPVTMTVAGDAHLNASSGKILSDEEIADKEAEEEVKRMLRATGNLSYEQRLAIDTTRNDNEVKPGSPIYVRVIDPAAVLTGATDTVTVKATTSSGDIIDAFPLTQKVPFSGVFEGQIPTASNQASASASDSSDSSHPNNAICASINEPWTGLPDGHRPKAYSVDLNDNVSLAKMQIVAGVTGRKLKAFQVQTSLNGREFTTVGAWPTPAEQWDGSPIADLVRYTGMGRTPFSMNDFTSYLEDGYVSKGVSKIRVKLPNVSTAWDASLGGNAGTIGMQGTDGFIARFQAGFDITTRATRTFEIVPASKVAGRFLLAIDGQIGADGLKITRAFSTGVHTITVYYYGTSSTPPNFTLQTDTNEPPFMGPVPADMFNPAKNIRVKENFVFPPATITATDDNSNFAIAFAAGPRSQARVVRLLITDFETDAPAIKKITLTDTKGKTVLPVPVDYRELRKNQTLEIVPGDKINITYNAAKPVTNAPDKKKLESSLSAAYHDGELSACYVEYDTKTEGSDRKPFYIPMRRFEIGKAVNVFIKDQDLDVSDKLDTATFTVSTPDGKSISVNALETEVHSGIFVGTFVPVNTDPTQANEIKVAVGDDVTIKYRDQFNTNPGIPWDRIYTIEQAVVTTPEIRVFNEESLPIPEKDYKSATESAQSNSKNVDEKMVVTKTLVATRPVKPDVTVTPNVFVDGPFLVELSAPFMALSPKSKAVLYAQSTKARAAAGVKDGDPFDVNVPGTIKVETFPAENRQLNVPNGYKSVGIKGGQVGADTALDEGRFTFLVPMALGAVPEKSLIDEEPTGKDKEKTPLMISGTDDVVIGFKYKSLDGQEQWITRKVHLISDPFFDVMDRRYQDQITGIHVGEKLYFRVIHKSADATDDKDNLILDLKTTSGKQVKLPLSETLGHSGVFKGVIDVVYDDVKPADAGPAAKAVDPNKPADASADAIPTSIAVRYGDKITATYSPSMAGATPLVKVIDIFMGADGTLTPFTKRFKDPAIAVQTQFTIAEAYFELAKKYRDLNQEALSRRVIAQGKKLLEESIRDYPDTEFRAQADYLLANLDAEFAKDATNDEIKKRFQRSAITRFSNIVSSYPDNPYAPKAQFKKALTLEQMGDIDQACEEYIKLSYRYPENDLVADTIVRLGQYFLNQGKAKEDDAAAATDIVQREKIKLQAHDLFRTGGQVFGRLAERFPTHRAATRATVQSAVCFLRAEDYDKAIEIFKRVIDDTKSDKESAAYSMYWAASTYMNQKNPQRDLLAAYRMFKKLTWDYPESQYAKFARGRLTEEELVKVQETDDSNSAK